jgi:3-dehydroquinate dehydratase type I
MQEALNLIEKAEKAQANIIEVRLDCLEETRNLKDLAKSTNVPLIAANKLLAEKGFFSGTETEQQQTLLNAAKNGFEYVDVNLLSQKHKKTISQLKQSGAKPIVSYHKFDGTLSATEMERVLEEKSPGS